MSSMTTAGAGGEGGGRSRRPSAAGKGLKHRNVVSNFIFKMGDDGAPPQVALFKRSDKVSTYT
jgi:hypothetical protein